MQEIEKQVRARIQKSKISMLQVGTDISEIQKINGKEKTARTDQGLRELGERTIDEIPLLIDILDYFGFSVEIKK